MSLCLEGQRLLTAGFLSQILVNRLSPWIGRPALPDVLAAHLHPSAPSSSAGLLLVSWLCRTPGSPGVRVRKSDSCVDPVSLEYMCVYT